METDITPAFVFLNASRLSEAILLMMSLYITVFVCHLCFCHFVCLYFVSLWSVHLSVCLFILADRPL